jgi:hypothetical protein
MVKTALIERKRRLRRLIRGHDRLLFTEQIPKRVELFQAVCARDIEGLVAKPLPRAVAPKREFPLSHCHRNSLSLAPAEEIIYAEFRRPGRF